MDSINNDSSLRNVDKLYNILKTKDLINLKRNNEYAIQFEYNKPKEHFDSIIVSNMPLFDDEYSEKENYFSIILMRYSKRLGCFVEGYKKITTYGWIKNCKTIEEVLIILDNL